MEKIIKTKKQILEALEGKRTEAVWNLIEKSITKIYKRVKNKIDFSEAKKEFKDVEDEVNNPEYRWIVIEHYNIEDGFFGNFYEDIPNINTGKPNFAGMFVNYFDDDVQDSTGEQEILFIDMKEMKSYLIDKEIKFHKQEIKI